MGDRIVRARFQAVGRVQGVFYRQSALERAQALGVSGWIRNRPDGDVEGEVEGPAPAVDAFLDWCRQGPPAARVDSVTVSDGDPEGDEGPFRVVR